MQAPVEPPPCTLPFSAESDGRHYYWRGLGDRLGSNIIAVLIQALSSGASCPPLGLHPLQSGVVALLA